MDLLPGAMKRIEAQLFEGLMSTYANEWLKAWLLEAIGVRPDQLCTPPPPYPGRDTDEALMAEVLAMEDE